MTKELLQVDGTVDAVVFCNEENGYTVVRLNVGGEEPLTVVGCMPGVAAGEGLTAHGTWGNHSTYGQQFKAETIQRRIPQGEKEIFHYLASGALSGVGVVTARRMIDIFGADTLTVLENEPKKLTQIKGITPKRAVAIGEAFQQQMGMRHLLEFLAQYDMPLHLAMPLYRRFGGKALARIQSNPYLLTHSDMGIDFALVDGLALSMGLSGDAPQRLEAGLLFELNHNMGNGHVFLPRHKLLGATAQLLEAETERVADILDEMIGRNTVTQEEVAGETACYLATLYDCECYVAQRLEEMSNREFLPPGDLEQLIDIAEQSQGIAYASRQRELVELAAQRQVVLLTGGPGTGKTTALRGVLRLFEMLGLNPALAAPTGRAAKRMSETCDADASTIHRLLETQFDSTTGQLTFAHDEDDPLDEVDAVIVDEASMVDIVLMDALLSALRGDCRLILVGDPDQLPSVGPGNVFSDLLRSNRLPTVRLTEIFRQATQSEIVMNAHGVNRGEVPDLVNRGGDFFFLRRRNGQMTTQTIVDLVSSRLPEKMGIQPDQIQVLSPTRKHQTGTAALNVALQAALNPPREGRVECHFRDYTFREGDRVMQIKNNYDAMWQEGQNAGMGIFNGDIGQITSIAPRGERITVDFEGRLVEYTPDMLDELEPSYAITVHKSQGSEYRAVVFAALDGAPQLLSRGVLYTAITRAKELFVAVGDETMIARMTANNRQQRRYSGLRARLAQNE